MRPAASLLFGALLPLGACITYTSPPVTVASTPVVDAPAAIDDPAVRVWLAGDDLFQRGAQPVVQFRTDSEAYVTVVRVDTEGHLRVLYPASPAAQRSVRGGQIYRVRGRSTGSFTVSDLPGTGYVVAIVAWQPFDYSAYSTRGSWDHRLVSHGRSDAFMTVREFADRVMPDRQSDYAADYVEYHVGKRTAQPVIVGSTPPRPVIARRGGVIVQSRPSAPVPTNQQPSTGTGRRPNTVAVAVDSAKKVAKDTASRRNNGRRRGHEADGPGNSNNAPRRGHEADGPGNSNNAPGRVNAPRREARDTAKADRREARDTAKAERREERDTARAQRGESRDSARAGRGRQAESRSDTTSRRRRPE